MIHKILKTALIPILIFCAFNISAQKPFKFNNGKSIETVSASELKVDVFNGIKAQIKMLNAQLPIQIDDVTEMYSAVLNGTTINYNYTAYIDSSLLTDEEIRAFCNETKEIQKNNILFMFKQNADKMPVAEWKRLYHELGIKYNYNYIDTNRKVWAKIVVEF